MLGSFPVVGWPKALALKSAKELYFMPTASSSTTADQAFFQEQLQRFGPLHVETTDGAAGKAVFSGPQLSPEECFAYCKNWATRHYENFAVVSVLLPRKLRPHFYNIYAYCRWSDNLADEVAGAEESLRLLEAWAIEAQHCFPTPAHDNPPSEDDPGSHEIEEPRHPILQALKSTVGQYELSKEPFFDLLNAFTQDQITTRYASRSLLEDYCQRSANPVGRILLQLAGADTPENCHLSDQVCTGLQLANFCQDLERDAANDRIYAPIELQRQFDVTEQDLLQRKCTPQMKKMLAGWVHETREYFRTGRPLIHSVPKWLSIDIALFIGGGEAILDEIERNGYDVWTQRPTVSKSKKLQLLVKALFQRILPKAAASNQSGRGTFNEADRT